MRFLFVIQGEGRGHQTQAISVAQMVQSQGHEIMALVGVPDGETLPTLLKQQSYFACQTYKSPNLVYNSKNNALSIPKTVFKNLRAFPHYIQSIQKIEEILHTIIPVQLSEDSENEYQRVLSKSINAAFKNCGAKEGEIIQGQHINKLVDSLLEELTPWINHNIKK